MHRSSAVWQQRCGHSEVAVSSHAVSAQRSWRRHAGSARMIPNTLAQEMQYAGHIGMPKGRHFPLDLGMYALRTGSGSNVFAFSPSLSLLKFSSKLLSKKYMLI